MEILPKDAWVFGRPAGVVYSCCVLVAIAIYTDGNRIAPVAGTVSAVILALVFVAFLLLAGTSGETRIDPSNALAILLIAFAFFLDGFFIAGASTFGPVSILDVGVADCHSDCSDVYFWSDGHWLRAKLPRRMSEEQRDKFRSWSGNAKLTNDLKSKPGRILVSTWDRQVYSVTMKNWTPPTTIGEAPHANSRPIVELFCGLFFLVLSLVIWREGYRRGIRYRVYDPFVLLRNQLRR